MRACLAWRTAERTTPCQYAVHSIEDAVRTSPSCFPRVLSSHFGSTASFNLVGPVLRPSSEFRWKAERKACDGQAISCVLQPCCALQAAHSEFGPSVHAATEAFSQPYDKHRSS